MKLNSILPLLSLSLAFLLSACDRGTELKVVRGTLDGPVTVDPAPETVLQAMDSGTGYYETILEDTIAGVRVQSLLSVAEDESSEGYGILVTKDGKATYFPGLYHGRNPLARYDKGKDVLWLTCGVMEGTGVLVEKPCLIHFDADGTARIVAEINPYDVQQALMERLRYNVKGEEITFFDQTRDRIIGHLSNTVTDMGGFDAEQPVWIGEQFCYDISNDDLYIQLLPGVKYTTGLVLHYDDSPLLVAEVSIKEDGTIDIPYIEGLLMPFTGVFLDEDNGEPNLFIDYRRSDGKYDVRIGIFRLAEFDDGIAVMGDDGLEFTATDPSGNPIGGVITLHGDTTTVTFTDSTWPLLESGTSFRYTRNQ